MPISGAMNSTKGRGIYLTTVEFMAKSHLNRGKNGILTKWGIDKDANIADFEQLFSNQQYQNKQCARKGH